MECACMQDPILCNGEGYGTAAHMPPRYPFHLQAIAEEVAALGKQLAERSTTLRELKRTLLQVGSACVWLVGRVE
jgi:hypothetical protein